MGVTTIVATITDFDGAITRLNAAIDAVISKPEIPDSVVAAVIAAAQKLEEAFQATKV